MNLEEIKTTIGRRVGRQALIIPAAHSTKHQAQARARVPSISQQTTSIGITQKERHTRSISSIEFKDSGESINRSKDNKGSKGEDKHQR